LHAIFNAPLDLADHPRRAVDCAVAIRDFGERYRREEQAAAAGFGRTRIGIETGLVVVGDVGGGRKLDYTAHGEAMNMAARLEAANKDLGSSICVGPGTASRLPNRALRPLGRIEVRGRATAIDVFDAWPDGMDRAERKTYLKAIDRAERDPMAAAEQLEKLASLKPDDPVPARLATRLRMVGVSTQLAELDRKLRPEPRPRANYPGSKKRKRR
jgi:adenylate cyclase